MRKAWALAMAAAIGADAQAQPTFQPVSEKIFPAEPIFTVRSRMPGRPISGVWRRPSNTRCSHTSSHTAITSCLMQASASSARSSGGNTTAEGFSGLLNSTSLVFGEKACARASGVMRQCGGCRRTKRGVAPAILTSGR